MRVLGLWIGFGYIAIELLGFSVFISHFGFFSLVLEIVLSGAFGLWLFLKKISQLNLALNQVLLAFFQGNGLQMFSGNMLEFFGAVLLVIPGVFSDCVGVVCVLLGLLLQFLGTRTDRYTHHSKHNNAQSDEKAQDFWQGHSSQSQQDFRYYYYNARNTQTTRDNTSDDDIIDVEVLESSTQIQQENAQDTQSTRKQQ